MTLRHLVILALVLVSCGSTTDDAAQPSAAMAAPTSTAIAPTTTTVAIDAVSPLEHDRFAMTLAVEPEGGAAEVVAALHGEARVTPAAGLIFGTLSDERLELQWHGAQWWDLTDAGLPLSDEEVAQFLTLNGFLRPVDVRILMADETAWDEVGTEQHLGTPTTHLRRNNIVKDRDWSLGDVSHVDVWVDRSDAIVKLVASWATGDNRGFPISTWEITERNPEMTVPDPPTS